MRFSNISTVALVALLVFSRIVHAENRDTEHFTSVDPTGLPYAILIHQVQFDGLLLDAGDEIAVFDGALCVGSIAADGSWPLSLVSWEGDPAQGVAGFTGGNPILFKVWEEASGVVRVADAVYAMGNGEFGFGAYSDVELEAFSLSLHFYTVEPTGLPYAIIVDAASLDDESLVAGDEVAVFDGDLCVGSMIHDGAFPVPITAWMGDPSQGLEGFVPGNPISYRVWSCIQRTKNGAIATYTDGDGAFGSDTFSRCSLAASSLLELPESLSMNEDTAFSMNIDDYLVEEEVVFDIQLEYDDAIQCSLEDHILTIQGSSDWFGTSPLTVRLHGVDGNFLSGGTIQVEVLPVDDPPVLAVPFVDPFEIDEDEYTMWCIAADEIISHFVDVDNDLFADDVCVDLAANFCGEVPIEVCVTGGEDVLCASFNLQVICINDAPVVTMTTSSGTACGDVENLGHLEGSTEGFIPEWQAGLITLDLADVENTSLFVIYFIDGEIVLRETWLLGEDISLPYLDSIADYFDSNVSFHIEVSDGYAPPWNLDGSECIWNLGFLDLSPVELPREFYLQQNYPNPFNPTTTIRFGLPEPQHIRAAVYNIAGQKVGDLLDEAMTAGHHTVQWNAEALSSGVYFFVMESDFHQQVIKMTYIR